MFALDDAFWRIPQLARLGVGEQRSFLSLLDNRDRVRARPVNWTSLEMLRGSDRVADYKFVRALSDPIMLSDDERWAISTLAKASAAAPQP